MDKYLFFTGKGKGTLIGIPARDLSYEEARKYGITNLLASGLYVYNSNHAIPEQYQYLLGSQEEEKDDFKIKPKRKYYKKERE